MKVSKILFPTDFSESSLKAAEYVADLALKYGARILMLHVIYDIAHDSGWYGMQLDLESIYEDVRKSAKEEMRRTEEKVFKAGGMEVETTLCVGKPADEILALAGTEGVDMIVMGSHGRKVIGRVLFGSTAQRVVRRAPCPVLTVRESDGKPGAMSGAMPKGMPKGMEDK